MALRTNFLAVLTKSPLRTGGVNVMAEGRGGELLIEHCEYRGVLALFARPFYALGAFSERQCKYHKAPKAGIYWGVGPAPCEQPTTLSVSVTGKESHWIWIKISFPLKLPLEFISIIKHLNMPSFNNSVILICQNRKRGQEYQGRWIIRWAGELWSPATLILPFTTFSKFFFFSWSRPPPIPLSRYLL